MGEGIKLVIEHIATGRNVKFSGFAVTEYQDNLTTSWNKQEVYGRMDPIMTYQGTGREISMGIQWKSIKEVSMKERHKEITKLMMFQYPTYADFNNAMAIQSPPVVRVKFAQLIGQGTGETGLICTMNGVGYTPDVGFTPEDSPMIRFGSLNGMDNKNLLNTGSGAEIIPKVISLKLQFTVLHEKSPGWHFNKDERSYGWMQGKGVHFGPGKVGSAWGWVSGSSGP